MNTVHYKGAGQDFETNIYYRKEEMHVPNQYIFLQ